MKFELKGKLRQGKFYKLNKRAWTEEREKIERDIRLHKAWTRGKPHTEESGRLQYDLHRLKQKATLLYLMRGYDRNRLTHFGHGSDDEKRHVEKMQDLMDRGWALEWTPGLLDELPTPADIPISRIEVKYGNPVPPNGTNRIEADRGERVDKISATPSGAANLLSRLVAAIRGADSAGLERKAG